MCSAHHRMMGSTSSLTQLLSHLQFLFTGFRPVDTRSAGGMFSAAFETMPDRFTTAARKVWFDSSAPPCAMHLKGIVTLFMSLFSLDISARFFSSLALSPSLLLLLFFFF